MNQMDWWSKKPRIINIVVDVEKYPAIFKLIGPAYILKIEKK